MTSNREQLQKLMETMQEDQKSVVAELNDFLLSPEAMGFFVRLEEFHKRTIPGSHIDLVLSSVQRVTNSAAEIVSKTLSAQLGKESRLKAEPELPLVPEMVAPIEADALVEAETVTIVPDAPVVPEPVGDGA